MSYTDATKISNYLQRSLTSYETAFLTTLLPAIDLYIDRYTDTTFAEATVETTRYYDGGYNSIQIDPVTDVSAIELLDNDGTVVQTYVVDEEYVLEPQNETIKSGIIKRYGHFPRGTGLIAVTGKFSSYNTAVPADIVMAATKLAADALVDGKNSSTGNIASESLEGHSITYRNANEIIDKVGINDPSVIAVLDSYRQILVE